jgi:cation/acetate symporter
LAASTFCPLFVLGIWWSKLTSAGAAAGIVGGGVVAVGLIVAGLVADTQGATSPLSAILTQPAIVTVPIAFSLMIAVSLLTTPPDDVAGQMLVLHAPEDLGLESLEQARA